ncbi:MAG TPA: PASTA domain-containing protein [Vicinamibacterales bacterium]|nr:PASTA domain-containing protein [Vicinamibacterales bacterium]
MTPLRSRVWSLGKFFVLMGALGVTFLVFFGVSMRVALWARDVQVPSLVGRTVNEATAALADRDLALRVEENKRPDDKIEVGKVMQQEPDAGVTSRRQRTVRVWISSGPKRTIVPPLVGQNERAAQSSLQQQGVVVSSVSEFRSSDYPADVVVAQDPAATSRAPEVSILLNRGELSATYVMPDVIGVDGERAADALRQQGFRVSIVGAQPYPGVPPGTVVRQQPAGGFRVGGSDAISLEVSR